MPVEHDVTERCLYIMGNWVKGWDAGTTVRWYFYVWG